MFMHCQAWYTGLALTLMKTLKLCQCDISFWTCSEASTFTLFKGVRHVLPGCKFLHDLSDLKDYIRVCLCVSSVLYIYKLLIGSANANGANYNYKCTFYTPHHFMIVLSVGGCTLMVRSLSVDTEMDFCTSLHLMYRKTEKVPTHWVSILLSRSLGPRSWKNFHDFAPLAFSSQDHSPTSDLNTVVTRGFFFFFFSFFFSLLVPNTKNIHIHLS